MVERSEAEVREPPPTLAIRSGKANPIAVLVGYEATQAISTFDSKLPPNPGSKIFYAQKRIPLIVGASEVVLARNDQPAFTIKKSVFIISVIGFSGNKRSAAREVFSIVPPVLANELAESIDKTYPGCILHPCTAFNKAWSTINVSCGYNDVATLVHIAKFE